MLVASSAAQLLQTLSSPVRVRLLAAVAEREDTGDCSMSDIGTTVGLDLKTTAKETTRLAASGLLERSGVGGALGVNWSLLQETATLLIAELPISRLLADDPDLAGSSGTAD